MAEENQDLRPKLDMIQSLIDISANRLDGLRTQCSTSAELTQQEIRSLEGKLITLFSRQLVLKKRNKKKSLDNIPSLKQWLQVVGLCPQSIASICSKIKNLEVLLSGSQYAYKNLLCSCPQRDEELRRLSRAHRNMKKYIDILLDGDVNDISHLQLHWDSWDYQSLVPILSTSSTSTEEILSSPEDGYFPNGSICYMMSPCETSPLLSPPLTPSRRISEDERMNSPQRSPGPLSKQLNNKEQYMFPRASYDESSQTLSKCRSPDLRRINLERERFLDHFTSNEPSTDNSSLASFTPSRDGESHCGKHKFSKLSKFSMLTTKCDLCNRTINFRHSGVKCKHCGLKCHRGCESKVTISCGETGTSVVEFDGDNNDTASITKNNCNGDINKLYNISSNSICHIDSPNVSRSSSMSSHPSPGLFTQIERKVKLVVGKGLNHAGSTTSSNHSSAPSSPASFIVKDRTQAPPATASAVLSQKQRFDFSPDALEREKQCLEDSLTSSDSREYSDVTLSSDRTINQDDSQDGELWEKTRRIEKAWPRQPSVSMKEWEIPWDELKMGDVLGVGHFGTVYSGYWHGDVAVKLLNMDYMADEKILETFKCEVSIFRKTRHDNLVLFMGACMDIPRLAIVTSMLHGITLYKYIHLRKDKFSMSKTTIIAQQISQGMGYLHAKGILHKDLRTKNIFLEKEKVIITDFGLFNLTKLCSRNRRQDGLVIPPGWLCYLAPEMMKSLRVHVHSDDQQLAFSKASDVYAFGTVWYELLCGDWPFKTHNPEVIIWQVGKGMKQSLANLEASRDVKDILMQCWCYQPSRRPDFTCLLKTLDKLPKKRLARSPSHPVHLSRSAESMF